VLLRNLRPIRLSRRPEPFDSDQFIFELKIDGFRALAHIEGGNGELISRNGNTFHGFADLAAWIAEHLRVESAVLDGEIACVDGAGRPVFRDLLFRRRQCSSRLTCCTSMAKICECCRSSREKQR
jgi:bifunctional non-homologous end joining protein LigD